MSALTGSTPELGVVGRRSARLRAEPATLAGPPSRSDSATAAADCPPRPRPPRPPLPPRPPRAPRPPPRLLVAPGAVSSSRRRRSISSYTVAVASAGSTLSNGFRGSRPHFRQRYSSRNASSDGCSLVAEVTAFARAVEVAVECRSGRLSHKRTRVIERMDGIDMLAQTIAIDRANNRKCSRGSGQRLSHRRQS